MDISNEMIELLTEIRKVMTASVPEFPGRGVPVNVVAKVYGKDADWVKAGIICGWLPIGTATRNGKKIESLEQMNSKYGRINYYISPKKLWEETGFIYKGSGKESAAGK